MPGTLFVIATPLGNLDDLSARAIATLRSVACVACEDTRRAGRLLKRLGIDVPKISCHRFNERERAEPILARLRSGEDVALVSDAGTPGISDPGAALVRAAVEEGVPVTPVPGPSAAAAALSASGFPADRYVFEGYLPHRAGPRRKRLRELARETRPIVVFESPLRLDQTLRDLAEIFGSRPIVLNRELTKLHETIVRGTAEDLVERLRRPVRGEVTLVISGAAPGTQASSPERRAERVRQCWRASLTRHSGDARAALRHAARALEMKRSELWRYLEELGELHER